MKDKIKNLLLTMKSMWNKPLEGRYLTIKEVGAFGLYALGNSWMYNAVTMYVVTITFIPYYYGIPALHGYLILILGNLLNMILQPLIGTAMERRKTKWGRYKPYILFSLPLIAFFTMLAMWIPQYQGETTRIIYAYISCTPVIAISTFANNMYQTMPNVITPNSQERADIMTPVGLLVGAAPSIMQLIVGPMRAAFKAEGQEFMAMRILGLVSVVVGSLCVLFIIKVKERVYELESETAREEKVNLFTATNMLIHNKPLIILAIALVLGSLREFWKQYLQIMVQIKFDEVIDTALNISGVPLTIIGFASTVAMLLLPLVTRKMSKHHIVILFSALGLVSMTILSAVGFERFPVGTVSAVVLTILMFLASLNPTYLLIPVMLGEIADYQQAKTGKRLEGHLQNYLFTLPLLASQVFMLIGWYWQQSIGFEPNDYYDDTLISYTPEQQAIASEWFDAVFIISAVSMALLIIVLLFYPLTKKKHAEIAEMLKAQSVNLNDGNELVLVSAGEGGELVEVADAESAVTIDDGENGVLPADYDKENPDFPTVEDERTDDGEGTSA